MAAVCGKSKAPLSSFARSGEITEPCGVPVRGSDPLPSSMTPAFSHFWINRRMRGSATRCSMNLIIQPLSRLSGLHLPFVHSVATPHVQHCVRTVGSVVYHHSGSCLLYPRGPRSGLGFVVPVHQRLFDLICPTRRQILFRRTAVYTGCLRCAGAPRRPASGSVLSLCVPSRHAVLIDHGESIGCFHSVLHQWHRPSPRT